MSKIIKYLIFSSLIIIIFSLAYSLVPTVKSQKSVNIERIISTSPSVTASLFDLGYADKVVGVSNYCVYPVEVQKLPKIGALDDPNFEFIMRLKPDIIISSSLRHKEYLEKLGLNFLYLEQDKFSTLINSFQVLDNALGNKAKNKIEAIKASFDNFANQNTKNIKIAISIMREPYLPVQSLYLAGNDEYFDDIIKLVGAQNIYTGKIKYPIISAESLNLMQPDIIVDILPPHTDIEKAKLAWQNLNIPAVKNDKILIFADESALIPGLKTLDLITEIKNYLDDFLDNK